ncbi:MAG: hypothetical protein HKN70_13930 [Gammaproteobacteria bacterium]|nr:hypothetical protein [Gammaproteobacteria bacterium]
MNRLTRLGIAVCVGLLFCVGAVTVAAKDMVSVLWMVEVDIAKQNSFESALVKHLALRKKANDPWQWQTYRPVTGNHLNMYGIRACCFDWSAIDAYGKWSAESNISDHWTRTVEKYVSRYEHYYTRLHPEDSHWPEDLQPAMVGVTAFYVKPGGSPALYKGMKKMSALAKEGGWPRHWSWASGVGGKPMLQLVTPYQNYAAMETPEEDFMAFLTKSLGSEDQAMKLWNSFASGYDKSVFTLYRHDPSLSMAEDNMVASK